MKNKTLKAVIAAILIVVIIMADFILVGVNLVTYALENIDNSTSNDNVKFAVFFKTDEGEKTQTEYEINNSKMKLYMEITVENSGYFDGVITLAESNFKLKQESSSDYISKIDGNTITLNRVRAGNTAIIELGIEPIEDESYSVDMLNKQSALSLSGSYTDSTEESVSIEAEKNVTLNLLAPSDIDTDLQGKVITNKIYKIGDTNKRLVQLELNSAILKNAYPVKATTFDVALPEGVEGVEVISKGTYATNGETDKILEAGSYEYDQVNQLLKITIDNPAEDGKISWKKEGIDSIVVTMILAENTEITQDEYSVKSNVVFQGEAAKTIEKEVKYNLTGEAEGIITATVENKEEIYKGKIYSKEEREYESTTNIEVNYVDLVESASIAEKTIYRTESEDKQANIEYKSTTISKAEIEKILGQVGSLTIKHSLGETKITKDTADENGNIVITYAAGVKELEAEITNAAETGIIRLNHTKVIKTEEYEKEEIDQLKNLVEQVTVKYDNTVKYEFEEVTKLKDITSEAALTVMPKTLTSEDINEMQMVITLKTDKEQYELFNEPTFTITMPEGVTINSLSDKSISASDGGLTISKLEPNGQREIQIELDGSQLKYITSEINTQINFVANVSVEKLMPNKIDTIKMQYTNQGKTYNLESEAINLIASKDKIVTNLKVENYNELGLALEKYSDSTNTVIGELPLESTETFEAPIKYTIINNYDSAISLTGTIIATLTDENGNEQKLIDYTNEEITIEAGNMQLVEQVLSIPADLYYSEKIEVEALVEYTYLGTKYTVNNNINLITEEKEGIRDISIVDEKLQLETFVQYGDGTGIKQNDQICNEQVITYIIEVTNISNETISNLKITNTQENGNIFDLKEVLMHNRVEEFIQHEYAELDTNEKVFEIETLAPGESKELACRVVVKKSEEDDVTTANIKVSADSIEEQNIQKISNFLKDADLKISTKNALKEEVGTYGDDSLFVLTNIKNLTNQKIEEIKVRKYMTEGIIYNADCSVEAMDMNTEVLDILSEVIYNEEEQYIEFTITELNANEEIQILSSLYIKALPLEQMSSLETVYIVANDVVSNNIESNVKQKETKLTIAQSINIEEDQKVKDGEILVITGEVTNVGNIDTTVVIEDDLPDGLEVVKVEVIKDNNVVDKTEDAQTNYVSVASELAKGESVFVKIQAKVNTSRIVTEEIVNKMSAVPEKGEIAVSNEVTIKIESIIDDSTEIEPDETPDIDEPDNKDPEPEKPDEDNPEPEKPDDGEVDDPNKGDENEPEKDPTYTISGYAWIDNNENTSKDSDEAIKGVIVKIVDLNNQNTFLKDSEGKEIEVRTDANGEYEINDIPKGNYNLIFKYDTNKYELKANTEIKDYIIESTKEKVAITSSINLDSNRTINLELKELTEFDLKIDKYISKVILQTSNETKTTEYPNKQLVREEINKKYISGARVLVEYTIQVSNVGELAGYATEIVDYLPEDMTFHSEINTQWHKGEDGNLYNTSLASSPINPGETKTIKLILLKEMNQDNTGTTSNIVEISDSINIKEYTDIDASNNQSKAEIIVNPATGAVITYIVAILNAILIVCAGAYIINKKIVRKEQSE